MNRASEILNEILKSKRVFEEILERASEILKGACEMETRLAIIGIIIEDREAADSINHLLSEYGDYIKGRMGLPYSEKDVSVISVVIDAPMDAISALSGKLGALSGVSTKTVYSKK